MTAGSDSSLAVAHDTLEALVAAEPSWDETIADLVEHPMRFIARRHRDEHVGKHVLRARNEKWHRLIDPGLLEAARNEGDSTGAFGRLARRYEEVLATAIEEAMAPPPGQARRVVRMVRFEILPPAGDGRVIGGFRAAQRSLLAWCPHRRLRIVAGMPVSEPGVASYRILTGYRTDLQGSSRQFDRHVLRRFADRPERSQERLLDPLPDVGQLPAESGAHG